MKSKVTNRDKSSGARADYKFYDPDFIIHVATK